VLNIVHKNKKSKKIFKEEKLICNLTSYAGWPRQETAPLEVGRQIGGRESSLFAPGFGDGSTAAASRFGARISAAPSRFGGGRSASLLTRLPTALLRKNRPPVSFCPNVHKYRTLIKKKIKFSSYKRKFRWE
jgi:hypothetical protein